MWGFNIWSCSSWWIWQEVIFNEHLRNWIFWHLLASLWIIGHSCFERFPAKNNLGYILWYECWEFKSTFIQVLKNVQSFFLKNMLYLSVFTCGRSVNPIFCIPFIPIRTSIFKWHFASTAEWVYFPESLTDGYSQWPSFGQWGVIGKYCVQLPKYLFESQEVLHYKMQKLWLENECLSYKAAC